MRYAQIRNMDISNGESIGVALFVQGCHLKCCNCFNPDTWDFNGGKEWTQETEDKFIELVNRPYIKRISILGGEPLAEENLNGVTNLLNKITILFPEKTIWLYTGYTWESIMDHDYSDTDDFDYIEESYIDGLYDQRKSIIKKCDVLVDGPYIDSKKDIKLKWCGSSNQRVIDIQKTLEKGEIVLWK